MNKPLPTRRATTASGALALVLLSSCSFIPAYERPAAPVPDAWTAPAKVGSGSTAVTEDWRAFFTDARLQGLIAAALEYNRDLRIAVARVEEARALAGIARADRFPGVDVNLQQSAARIPADLSSSGREVISRRYDGNLGIAAFELDFWGRVKSLDEAARAGFLASDYARQSFRLSLIADVANAWFSLMELQERLALAETTVKTRSESRWLIERRRDIGLAGDLDFLAADGAYQSARAEVASLARQRASAENALRLLVGSSLPAEQSGPSFLAATTPVADIAVGLPAEVLLHRPDVLAAEQKLLAANANIGAARAAFLPRITLTALAGSASPALSGLFGSGSGAWSFVPLLKWPLFDAGRAEGNVDLAEARKNIAVAEYEKAIQQAFREVADLLAARTWQAEQLEALEAAAVAQAERLKRVEARHLGGVSSYLELLDAQRDHFAAQQLVLTTKRGWATTAASLYKALGGAS